MRILITRPRTQATSFADKLLQLGAEVAFFPTIEIKPVDDPSYLDLALTQLECYDWMVLTSTNAAKAVLDRMSVLGIKKHPQNLSIAAIGSKTAGTLKDGGILPDFVPDHYVAEAILPGMGDLRDSWVLLPMADIAHDTLPKAIQNGDGIAHVVTAYHTVPAEANAEGLALLKGGVDIITFTSGSTVQNFCMLIKDAGLDFLKLDGNPTIACIGPKTAKVARDLGLGVDIIADPHTTDGLVAAIKKQILENTSI